MAIVTCIFCYAQVVSRDEGELEVKYESHLVGWHNIADKEERKLALLRTREKYLPNKYRKQEGEKSLFRDLSEKIEIAMKNSPSAVKQQLVIENEDYIVESMVIGSEEPVEVETVSNQITAEVEREESVVDDGDIVGDEINNEGTENVDVATGCLENEISLGDEFDQTNCEIVGKEVEIYAENAFALLPLAATKGQSGDQAPEMMEFTETVPVLMSQKEYEEAVDTVENATDASDPKELVTNESSITKKDTAVDEVHISDWSPISAMTPGDSDMDGNEVVKDCSVKVTRLKDNMIKHMVSAKKMVDKDISVPWYEWGHHVCVACGSVVFLGSVERHLDIHHSMSLVKYMEQYELSEDTLFIPPYECLVCGVAVVHTNKKIVSHLQLHNMDMGSYYFQYIKRAADAEGGEIKSEDDEVSILIEEDNTKQVEASSKCSLFNSNNTTPMKRSLRKRSLPAFTSRDPLRLQPTPAGPGKKRRHSSTEPAEELPWYDSSWHQCLECDKVTTRGRFFTSHVKEHKMSKKQYLEKFPSEKVENVPSWTCGICSKKIPWMGRSISSHLSVHTMSRDQYAREYINNEQEVGVEDWGEEAVHCDNGDIVLEGEPQIQRLESSQDISVLFDKYSINNDNVGDC
eukprot:GFUD01016278.1.p1 GENE.GFUD01016278.1~~GFUD01016278.1.p1  ORF type:complete len:632 (+),score=189.14 GFUD01016278.1:55-1950(+)